MTSARWAMITGVSPGGMGEGHAIALLDRGINVVVTAIDKHLLEDLQIGETKATIEKVELDVTSPTSIARAVEEVTKITNGRLDYLFNNAGYGYYMPLLDVDVEKARKEYDVNVWGVLGVTQAFFPLLREAKGTVVNQGSMAGVQGYNRPYMGIYSSSKAAVHSLSDCMRVELAPFDVKVVTLMTGAVSTQFFNHKEGGRTATLPPTSPYQPIRKHIETMINRSVSGGKGHDRLSVTGNTITALLNHRWFIRTRYIRRGFGAIRFWLLHLLLPVWLLDRIARRSGALDTLREVLLAN